jgi:hypothetical protein
MERSVRERLHRWEATIIHVGIFLIFLATFSEFVFKKVWPIIKPFLQHE